MEIKKGDKSFIIEEGASPKEIYIQRDDGEAGQFQVDALAIALYDAIDKFFRENF